MQENEEINKIGPRTKPKREEVKELEPDLPDGFGRGVGFGDGLVLDF